MNCNFSQMIRKCDIQQASLNKTNDDFMFYEYDWSMLAEITRTIFNKYINLIFSTCGIAVNICFVVVFSNKKIMKEKLYFYMLANSYFNLFYSLIATIKFSITCLELYLVIDPEFYVNIYSQYLSLILFKFCSNILRTSSNISCMAFTIDRFIMATNMKGPFWVKFKKINTKLFNHSCCVSAN